MRRSLGAVLLAGCSTMSTNGIEPGRQSSASTVVKAPFAVRDAIQTPALISVNPKGILRYWPLRAHGGNQPQRIVKLSGIQYATGAAANGNVVAVTGTNPSSLILYDVAAKKQTTLADPNGSPVDVAIDKSGNIFVANFIWYENGNVTMYRARSLRPRELKCQYIGYPTAIAGDNEGDIFLNGEQNEEHGSFTGIVEIPNGPRGLQPQKCQRLPLPESGYAAGLVVDPKTDNLVVFSNPDYCAGGVEGLMTIYPKPYNPFTAHSVQLGANCATLLRLDAESTRVFFVDSTYASLRPGGRIVPGVRTRIVVVQRSYPDGGKMGKYRGDDPQGLTTIPNTLPN
jgi:hypothetical protein